MYLYWVVLLVLLGRRLDQPGRGDVPEAARVSYNLVGARGPIIAWHWAVYGCLVTEPFLFLIPDPNLLPREELSGPGIVPPEGPILQLCMPGPQVLYLLWC